jgi:D-threo-aldose 1-dehydrogenase
MAFPLRHPATAAIVLGARSPGEVRTNHALQRAPVPDALWEDLRDRGLIHPDA